MVSKLAKTPNSKFFVGTLLFFLIALLLVLLDQLIKILVENRLDVGESIPIISNVFHISLTHNTGMAFGILGGQAALSMWIAIIVIGVVIYYFDEVTEPISRIALALILGGTIGNFIDRLKFGWVVDYLDFRIWPVFNLADMALTVGVVILIIMFWKAEREEKH
jgi:signal peptidase II